MPPEHFVAASWAWRRRKMASSRLTTFFSIRMLARTADTPICPANNFATRSSIAASGLRCNKGVARKPPSPSPDRQFVTSDFDDEVVPVISHDRENEDQFGTVTSAAAGVAAPC